MKWRKKFTKLKSKKVEKQGCKKIKTIAQTEPNILIKKIKTKKPEASTNEQSYFSHSLGYRINLDPD